MFLFFITLQIFPFERKGLSDDHVFPINVIETRFSSKFIKIVLMFYKQKTAIA
jgi:hypothetical protein